jgi:hypothetical protein
MNAHDGSCRRHAGPGRRAVLAGVLALASVAVGQQRPGRPWKRHAIDDSSRGADGVRLADVNGDGRMDIITGWEEGGLTRLYLNPGAGKARAKWPAVTVGKTPSVEDAVFVDLDADGATDAVTSCEGRTRAMFVHWAPKQPSRRLDPAAWQTEPLGASRGAMAWMFCLPMQVDGRGGVDLIAAGKGRNAAVGWFQSPADPRELSRWKWHALCPAAWIMSLAAVDMDADGDLDVLVSERKGKQPGCYWLANPGPRGKLTEPWPKHWIAQAKTQVMFLCVADLDGDGLRDVLAACKPRTIAFHRRRSRDGKSWTSHAIRVPDSAGTAKAVNVGDVDLDGRPDLVFTCEQAGRGRSGVMWLSYRKSVTDAEWTAHDVSGPEGAKYDLVELIDLDGDGDLDALTCEESANLGVIWYENPTRSRGR